MKWRVLALTPALTTVLHAAAPGKACIHAAPPACFSSPAATAATRSTAAATPAISAHVWLAQQAASACSANSCECAKRSTVDREP